MRTEDLESMVQALAHILQDHGDGVLDGSHSLTLLTPSLQVVTRLFEQLFPRGPGSGFQALPAHPTDSGAVLGSQFVLDLVQKTPGLKLIHPAECPQQCDVNIFPFKSLKCLEVKCLPPHCLRGLRGVYSQLEVLIFSECVTSIEEVISSCGGDLSSALPWLELHTLNLSNNNIHSLDQSLELLNILRSLNLSRNFIKDCGPHLKILSELQELNLGYNLLESIPELSLQSSVQLHTLILSHNRLSSTRGLEHLSNLQHLNLSYNLLAHPVQLTCLTRLHNLKELQLKGNPLCYVPEHRALIAQHLSHKAFDKVLLDGEQITILEIAMTDHVYRERIMLPQCFNSATESSCTGEMSDSCSVPERIANRIPRKKSKIKVRRASISEPSDSECERELRSQPVVVLQHQKDIERTDSFREQFGDDWLQYRSHLEEELNKDKNGNGSPRRPASSQPFTKSKSSPIILQTAGRTDSLSPVPANPTPARPPTPEVTTVTAAADLLIEKIEDVLEDGLWQPDIDNKEVEEEEEEIIEDALCLPITVCPILDGKPRNPEWPWVFVRVTRQHLLEIDLERGRILLRRELQSLRDIQTSVIQWDWNEEEQEFPVLTLFFRSMCEEKQCARYVVLDNTSEISIKTLLDVLNPILEENLRLIAEGEEGPPKLKCLKCKTEFIHQDDSGVVFSAEGGEGQTQDNNHSDHTGCPSCGSFHVILAPVDQTGYSSTPTQSSPSDLPPEGAESRGQKFYLAGDERDGSETSSCLGGSDSLLNGTTVSEANVTGLTGSYRSCTATPPVRHNSMVLQDNWQVSPTSVSPDQILDFRLVDHRLKLYLDMEILVGEMEEFQCYMKVPVVRFGKEGAFWALVVVSNRKIYFLEITGETSGPPCDWLRPGEEQSLTSFTHLHIGLQKQTLHLGFGTPEAAYTLLTRNCHFSTTFAQNILDSMCELPPRYRKALDYSVEEGVTQGHPLWHLLHDDNLEEGDLSPGEYRYVLAYFMMQDVSADKPANSCANDAVVPQNTASPAALAQGAANATAVTLLLTRTHMYILEETYQWLHSPPPAEEDAGQEPAGKVQVKEKQPISSISSVHLYSSATLHLRIKLYNETQQKESAWLLWTENPDLPKEIAEWLRVPWESEYHIHLNPVIHETLD